MIVSVINIIDVFDKDMYKGCKNKRKLYSFEKFKMSNINYIYDVLKTGNYNMQNYNIFIIKYPKYRVVMSLKMNDKVINHYITKNALIPKLTKYLDDRNIATRKDMGCSYGVKLVKRYIELNKKYGRFYILKLDIRKYFYNIDHQILKSMLKELDEVEYKLICKIIDSTNESYVNKWIDYLKNKELKYDNRKKEIMDIPHYELGKGLPIGNMTSQFLAIYYLNKLDHYIVHNLKVKHMIRYMDDYVLFHKNKEYLKECLNIIEYKLNKEYKLLINKKKSKIYSIEDGFDYLGYKFKVIEGKTIIRESPKAINNVLKRVKCNIKKYNNNNLKFYYNSVNNYYYGFKYSKSLRVKRMINRIMCIYEEKT